MLIVGVAMKIRQYWNTPAPLKIPTMPAPTTQTGVVLRMAREVFLFESLFRSTKWTWIFGYMFHVGLALAFVRHLRYVMSPDCWVCWDAEFSSIVCVISLHLPIISC